MTLSNVRIPRQGKKNTHAKTTEYQQKEKQLKQHSLIKGRVKHKAFIRCPTKRNTLLKSKVGHSVFYQHSSALHIPNCLCS